MRLFKCGQFKRGRDLQKPTGRTRASPRRHLPTLRALVCRWGELGKSVVAGGFSLFVSRAMELVTGIEIRESRDS